MLKKRQGGSWPRLALYLRASCLQKGTQRTRGVERASDDYPRKSAREVTNYVGGGDGQKRAGLDWSAAPGKPFMGGKRA